MKLIPPGLHYIYCSASAAEDIGICRSGFFLHMKPKDVAVFRWDPENEELIRPDNEESFRYADGVRSFDFDRNLGPYPLELREQWAELTRHTTKELVEKIEPISGRLRSKRAEYDASTNPRAAEDSNSSRATLTSHNSVLSCHFLLRLKVKRVIPYTCIILHLVSFCIKLQ